MTGDLGQARKIVYDALARDSMPRNSSYHSRLLASLCFVNWIAADLSALKREASQLLKQGDAFDLFESTLLGRYFLGIAAYQQNELATAEEFLLPAVTNRFSPNLEYLIQSAIALSCVYEARGRADKARDVIDSVCEDMLQISNTTMLQVALAFQAELALRQGRGSESLVWAQQVDPGPFELIYNSYCPQITLAKALVLQGGSRDHERAGLLLSGLERFLSKTHNQRFLMEVFALQALLLQKRGEETKARLVLKQALSLAQPGGFIRLFADLGPGLAGLLAHSSSGAEKSHYINRILNAFNSDRKVKSISTTEDRDEAKIPGDLPPLPGSLTNREIEILGMLGKRFTNKEIGNQLHIAPATVKRHAENIYLKLGVSGRREAVVRAESLGILKTE
jgi:LuxR family maltose regulon positive regulatory protein